MKPRAGSRSTAATISLYDHHRRHLAAVNRPCRYRVIGYASGSFFQASLREVGRQSRNMTAHRLQSSTHGQRPNWAPSAAGLPSITAILSVLRAAPRWEQRSAPRRRVKPAHAACHIQAPARSVPRCA